VSNIRVRGALTQLLVIPAGIPSFFLVLERHCFTNESTHVTILLSASIQT